MKAFFEKKIQFPVVRKTVFVFASLFVSSLAWWSFASNEVTMTSAHNIFEDRDQDGLSNNEEKLYGTNAERVDTDGDGYSDGAEIRSGYDPLTKAPGDRIGALEDGADGDASAEDGVENPMVSKPNLTEDVAQKFSDTMKQSMVTKEPLSLETLQSAVREAMATKVNEEELPPIDVKAIHVKKQKYAKLSDADREAKVKDDTLEYVSSISYILINNSPLELKSESDIEGIAAFIETQSGSILTGNDPAFAADMAKRSVITAEQLASMTVPENMLETHLKALRLAQYAGTMRDDLTSSNENDPLMQIRSVAKVQSYLALLLSFGTEIQGIMTKYGIEIPL
jgi:hypothetical protein